MLTTVQNISWIWNGAVQLFKKMAELVWTYPKLLWLQIFCICHRCQRHWWQTLSCEYLLEFSKKIRNGHNGILRGLGETGWNWFMKKPRSRKSRDTVPLKEGEREPCSCNRVVLHRPLCEDSDKIPESRTLLYIYSPSLCCSVCQCCGFGIIFSVSDFSDHTVTNYELWRPLKDLPSHLF